MTEQTITQKASTEDTVIAQDSKRDAAERLDALIRILRDSGRWVE